MKTILINNKEVEIENHLYNELSKFATVHRMKIKGEKHSSSKVKVLAPVDVDKLNSINEFVDYAVTSSRYSQALENVFPNGEQPDIKKLGDVIRWVIGDVMKEEIDTMAKNNIEPKEINKYISAKVRDMFLKSL